MFNAFFDESGDEGLNGKCSPWLSLGGLIIPEKELNSTKDYLAAGVAKIWKNQRVPSHVHFHEVPSHAKRKALVRMLCGLNFHALFLPAHKNALTIKDKMKCPMLYNFVAKHALERVSWFGKHWNQKVNVTFASRSEISWSEFEAYIEKLRQRDDHYIHFDYIGNIRNIPAATNSLVQAADWITSGMACGLTPDEYGEIECCFAEMLWGKFWMKNGKLWSYGIKVLPHNYDRKQERLFKKIDTWLEDPTSI